MHINPNLGKTAIELSFLDEDFKPYMSYKGRFVDGFWQSGDGQKMCVVTNFNPRIPVDETYLLNYDDGLGMPTVEAAQSATTMVADRRVGV